MGTYFRFDTNIAQPYFVITSKGVNDKEQVSYDLDKVTDQFIQKSVRLNALQAIWNVPLHAWWIHAITLRVGVSFGWAHPLNELDGTTYGWTMERLVMTGPDSIGSSEWLEWKLNEACTTCYEILHTFTAGLTQICTAPDASIKFGTLYLLNMTAYHFSK